MEDYKLSKLNLISTILMEDLEFYHIQDIIDKLFEAGWDAKENEPCVKSDSSETACVKPLKLEFGKRYVMRNGNITSELIKTNNFNQPFADGNTGYSWWENGRYNIYVSDSERDIVAEYIEPTSEPKPIESEGFKIQQELNLFLCQGGKAESLGDLLFYSDGNLVLQEISSKDVVLVEKFGKFNPQAWKPYIEPKYKDWRDTVSPENPVFCWTNITHTACAYIDNYHQDGYLSDGYCYKYAEPVKPGEIKFYQPENWHDLLDGKTGVVCKVGLLIDVIIESNSNGYTCLDNQMTNNATPIKDAFGNYMVYKL